MAMLSMANVSAARGSFVEATAWIEQALLVDPLDIGINMNFGDHMIPQRRYDEAVRILRKALELAPGHRPSQLRCCWALALAGQPAAATALLESIGPTGEADLQWHEYGALVAGAAGDPQSALPHYEALERLPAPNACQPGRWPAQRRLQHNTIRRSPGLRLRCGSGRVPCLFSS